MSLSDPLRSPGKTPRRAEPQQPDRPGRGDDRLASGEDVSGKEDDASLARRIEQAKTALDNVSHP